jgi:hypothetical protein
MSTEIDEAPVDETARPLEPGVDWSSDEAAAEQEEMMANAHGIAADGMARGDDSVADKEVSAPQTADTTEPDTFPGDDDSEAGHQVVAQEPSTTDQAPGADSPFSAGSVAAVYSGQSAVSDERHSGSDPLVASDTQQDFLGRWNEIQVSFVDDPGTAVESAYTLTQEIGVAMLKSFEDRNSELAAEWRAATDTEQLRLALKQFRHFIGVILPK